MARKTSKLPTRVYKYALLSPIENADLVDQSFCEARIHYNQIITIDLVRRRKFREARSAMFPHLAKAEAEERRLEDEMVTAKTLLLAAKSAARSRKVDPVVGAEVSLLKVELREVRATIKRERDACYTPEIVRHREELKLLRKEKASKSKIEELAGKLEEELAETPLGRVGLALRKEAQEAIAALRPMTYHGTYLLVEAQARAATGGSGDPDYNDDPPHRLANRIGVHFVGGMGVEKLASSTLMQISPMPAFRPRISSGKLCARGKAARTNLKFRIGSGAKRTIPIWATFPMVMDRPLPADARIKDAYVTRRPCSARIPWRYDLCIVLESDKIESKTSTPLQVGTTAINFGWRLIDGELRVAMVNNSQRGLSEVRLPARILSGFAKCQSLQGILDRRFDVVKYELDQWIKSREDVLPEAFLREFRHLSAWKSQHRLAELVWYWREHRIPGDEEIFPRLSNPGGAHTPKTWEYGWLEKYRHLTDWLCNQRRYLLDWRDNHYKEQASLLARTSRTIVIDDFKISEVAKRAAPEEVEQGGEAARANRVMASPHSLRLAIKHAAAKYHCEVLKAKAANGTRRCNVCGFVQLAGVVELVHDCTNPKCPGPARWDQDVNNTDNLLEAAASGNVTPLVVPAEAAEDGEFQQGEI